ncbi:MAG: hypothetical protein ABGX16_07820 [Pirellulales bacterium]
MKGFLNFVCGLFFLVAVCGNAHAGSCNTPTAYVAPPAPLVQVIPQPRVVQRVRIATPRLNVVVQPQAVKLKQQIVQYVPQVVEREIIVPVKATRLTLRQKLLLRRSTVQPVVIQPLAVKSDCIGQVHRERPPRQRTVYRQSVR